jgi:hypothetical protein
VKAHPNQQQQGLFCFIDEDATPSPTVYTTNGAFSEVTEERDTKVFFAGTCEHLGL